MPPSDLQVVYRRLGTIRSNPRNARRHSKRQIRQIADSIKAFGFRAPILVDESGAILAGHGRYAAARLLGLDAVPTIIVSGLSDVQKRAYMVADNKLTENAGWDLTILASELEDLGEQLKPFDLDLTITGFDAAEIDVILENLGVDQPDPGDDIPPIVPQTVSREGDLWVLGDHRMICADARSEGALDRLMDGHRARMVFTDPPYNVRIHGHVQGRGRIRHQEFAFASGEMSEAQYVAFLKESCANFRRACIDGAIAFVCIDWRHLGELLAAGKQVFDELKNVIVWNKTSPGQGTFYRSQHEFLLVFKVGEGAHVNAFGLGQNGRMRSNVWTYPGVNSFRAGRADELAMHPTVKPVALVADAMRDCSMKGDIILDVFLGSGTTIMAAEKVGRRAYGAEIEPRYVDVAIRRWQAFTKADAILSADGRSFDEVAVERAQAQDRSASASEQRAIEGDEGQDTPDWVALCGSGFGADSGGGRQ